MRKFIKWIFGLLVLKNEHENIATEQGCLQIRGAVLDEARTIINGNRRDQYGNPEDNFVAIAELWALWLKTPVSAHDVAMMMALLKVARISTGSGTSDSYVDLCGYAALANDMNKSGAKHE